MEIYMCAVVLTLMLYPDSALGGSGAICPLGWGHDQKRDMCDICPDNTFSDSTAAQEPCQQCPADDHGVYSATKQRGSHSCFFAPYILDFSPKHGPKAGGTNITVHMVHMEKRTIRRFVVADTGPDAKIKPSASNDSVFYITSPSANRIHSGELFFEAQDNYGKYDEHSSHSGSRFAYMKDPIIKNISRESTIISGGLEFEVTGEYLNSTTTTLAIITAKTQKIQEEYISECKVDSITSMTCRFPDLTKLTDVIDILPAPTPSSSSSPFSTTKDSGILSPAVPPISRQRRLAEDGRITTNNIKFFIGFQMDGVTTYNTFREITVYRDPLFHRFTETNNLKSFNPNEEQTIRINGEAIDYVLTAEDITVDVGDSLCVLEYMATNQITCSPPKTKPKFGDPGAGPEESVTVIVRFGRRSFVVGYLQYAAGGGLSLTYILIIVLVGVVVLLILIIWCCCLHCCRKKVKKPKQKKKDVEAANGHRNEAYDGLKQDLKNNSYLDLHKLTNGPPSDKRKSVLQKVSDCILDQTSITIGEVIGKGQFGKVYKGQFKNKHSGKKLQVAIKTMQADDNETAIDEFLEEALVMKGFSHKNVVTMYGVTVKDDKPYVVLEYMDLGDLKNYISDPKLTLLITDLLKFAVQIAEGMTYLTGNRFVHRDLAARNCMINSAKVVKIADFGLSRDIYTSDYYRAETKNRPLPVRWMALESMETGVFNIRSDVWSYAIVLWELFTRGAKPYADISNYQLKAYLQLGKRLDKPEHCPAPLYVIMEACWNESAMLRPSFSDLVKKTKFILAKFNPKNQEKVNGANTLRTDDYLTAVR